MDLTTAKKAQFYLDKIATLSLQIEVLENAKNQPIYLSTGSGSKWEVDKHLGMAFLEYLKTEKLTYEQLLEKL